MIDKDIILPLEKRAGALLTAISPGSTLSAIHRIADDHHNETYIVDGHLTDGELIRAVVKRYVNNSHVIERARLEFNTLRWLQSYGVPAPLPLYMDDTGEILGSPGIVTRFVSGHQLMLPSDHPLGSRAWTSEVAQVLAKIHSIPCDSTSQEFLKAGTFNDNNVLWFMHPGTMPDYMKAHALGEVVWNTICNRLTKLEVVQPAFGHTDFWPGNILWDQGRIAAVLDWEESAYFNPGADVAYCRMDMFLAGHSEAAEEFLREYEKAMGRPTADLGFWELVAAVRPIFRPEGWISDSPGIERFQQFVEMAIRR